MSVGLGCLSGAVGSCLAESIVEAMVLGLFVAAVVALLFYCVESSIVRTVCLSLACGGVLGKLAGSVFEEWFRMRRRR